MRSKRSLTGSRAKRMLNAIMAVMVGIIMVGVFSAPSEAYAVVTVHAHPTSHPSAHPSTHTSSPAKPSSSISSPKRSVPVSNAGKEATVSKSGMTWSDVYGDSYNSSSSASSLYSSNNELLWVIIMNQNARNMSYMIAQQQQQANNDGADDDDDDLLKNAACALSMPLVSQGSNIPSIF